MDLQNKIRLHPRAREFLFENYYTTHKLFSDVLGQLEVDYISMAFINSSRQIFFLSSAPSIEQNLIETGSWKYEGIYQPDFIFQDKPKLWAELPAAGSYMKQQMENKNFCNIGISMIDTDDYHRIVFSFGFKKLQPLIESKHPQHCKKLLHLGKYCLRELKRTILFPELQKSVKSQLRLIINNEVIHEKNE
ncbi:flagellar biosynthesis protein FlgJ [Legionella geestiana]|uniref:flagellar biosynthesis protein FlgJ n=1 Tax=Legionella geestiana TaxID=45065 RepID=UPI001092A1E9|nr:flagellar biosynthesis protein FlgJ [Legionella geestiana]QDQ40693.1 flagellar biosynthesis protein FlgJ [Legionella geestiana]